MKRRFSIALLAWLAFVAACVAVISQTRFTSDLSAFLPRTPTAEQQVLVDQLKDGMVSRLLLIGIEGGDAKARADLSRALARSLRADPAFGVIENGEPVHRERDQKLLFDNRYLLSPAVTPEHFTVEGLHGGISESIDLLASPLGLLTKSLLPRDPTGETVRLLEALDAGRRPASFDGTWASHDGQRALLLAQTAAAGSDLDRQQDAIAKIEQAFADALAAAPASAADMRLLVSGPGKFAVASRAAIESEVLRLALVSTALIVTLLLFVYRSATALVLGLLPVVSGALAGIVAVSLGHGVVHGVTLGFGTTLIGEAVDYAIYLFVQSGHADDAGDPRGKTGTALWRTIRLGVLTSIGGFAALMFSGFPGLAQLGLYSIAGLVVAATTTRFMLPHLVPPGFRIRDVSPLGERLQLLIDAAGRLRWVVLALALAAVVVIPLHRDGVWNHELAALSPVPAEEQALDAALRADLGAPDVRYMVVVTGADAETALKAADAVGQRLQPLVADGAIGGFESPARFLPPQAVQQARRASLPEPGALADRLGTATAGLPLQAQRLAPFVADIATARAASLLTRADLDGTSFALAVDSLLIEQHDRWTALLPLRAPTDGAHGGELDIEKVRAALGPLAPGQALLIDMKGESDRLYADYLHEAVLLALAGVAAVVVLLGFALRSTRRVLRVLAPLVAAVIVVVAGLVLAGVALTILHLVGLLLIVAVGSNYALFFDSADAFARPSPRTLASMLFANLTTVVGFGVLAFSSVPVLQAIGGTVGPGAVLALLFSAILAGGRANRRAESRSTAHLPTPRQ
ncbi:MAG: MMPL family transporter [Aromatoleum sp.]|uniref:MMPL family transporter n=1 Tax=Aromatoleum sp. TaxID=2307007 RepID=UPI0028958F7C|nr:MMPL family transporter [Aromatoleum sp.]MDT3669731.1 MMPL family transporter [Aromatoleum sp.]